MLAASFRQVWPSSATEVTMRNPVSILFPLSLQSFLLILLISLPQAAHSQLSTSESITLLQIQQKLEYPDSLKTWNRWTNFCYLPQSSSVSVICSGNHVTSLTITGTKNSTALSPSFSIDSLFTVITHLPSLQSLSLISLGIWGPLPASKLTRLTSLRSLNLTSNSISGHIPSSSLPTTLTSLILSHNSLNGTTTPSLSSLRSLTEIDLSYNRLGPDLPSLPTTKALITLLLNNNLFRSQIPSSLNHLTKLQRLDLSSNHLLGPIPSFLFSLPTLWYLNLSGNHLTGAIPKTTTCGGKLWMVDISNNLIKGPLPNCIGSGSGEKKIFASRNCLSGLKYQHPTSLCQTQALAVEPPKKGERKNGKGKGEEERTGGVKLVVVLAMVAGIVIIFGAIIALLSWAICKRRRSDYNEGSYKPVIISSKKTTPGSSGKSPPATAQQTTPPFLSSKYVPTTLRMPALGLPSCRVFTLQEVEEATNNFDLENLIGEEEEELGEQDHQGQLYKGLLQSGAAVLIRSIKLRHKYSSKSLNQHAEVIGQLRNQNLVSVIGHCVVAGQDRGNKGKGSGARVFVVFEYVSNGTLREHLRDWRRKEVLKWPQRMTISMGIARGVHYLHGGIAPGVFGNRLNIEKILLDETLTPKVSGYKIPLPSKERAEIPPSAEKNDIYQLGAIFLEILTGKEISSESQLEEVKQELERSLTEAASVMHQSVDPVLRGSFAYQSVRTAAEITISCLSKDPNRRPSMEDVLWYLQYSIQAQQTWTTSGNLGINSGNIGLHLK